jgi:hypothetical protein
MYKQFHRHYQIGCLIIDIDWLRNKWDISISLSSKNWS